MATLTSIDPRKSKRTGDIPFTIDGTGFLTSDLSNDFSGAAFYTDISANGGSITDTDKLQLSVGSAAGSIAGVDVDHTFARAFDVSVILDREVITLPAMNHSKIIALRAFNDLDATTYYETYLGYSDTAGYYIKSEAFVSGSAVYNKTVAIDPLRVEGLKLVRSGGRIASCIKVGDHYTPAGSYLGFTTFDSRIKMYAANSSSPVSNNFLISILEYKVSHAVSLVDRSAAIESVSNTEIVGRTLPTGIGTGDVIVGFPDGTFAELPNGFEYTEKQGLNKDTKKFDVVVSIFNFHIKPSRNELFTSADSFVWDENYWIRPDKQNKNLYIPSLWDPVTANVPSEFLQSGYGDSDNLKLIDIKKFRAESDESWHARIEHGTYFVRNVPYYLFSSESITRQLETLTTEDGRSKQPLKFLPKPGIPISASTLTTNIESGLIVDNKRFSKRGKFTGIVQNGIELNTDVVSNIDKSLLEFTVKYNSNNTVTNWRIPVEGSSASLFTFILPSVPLKDFSVVFSRTDIFSTEKTIASFYGDMGTIYGETIYGEPLQTTGDYAVDYESGQVQVMLDQPYIDIGFVSYTFDYPAVIEFNDNYLTNKGGDIISPTSSDLNSLDVIGESDGSAGQIFRLTEFPVLDFSDSQFLDPNNFRLFLYDESDNSFETDWIRVRSIFGYGPTDKVYQFNADQGTVLFGDGINGLVPQKYKKIVAGYKASVRIEYEPISSVDYWIGRDTDLNLSKNSLNSGFLYLSRKELIPDTISIEFSTDKITALDFAELSAVVRDADGDPVPSIELEFEIVNGNGNLEESTIVTDSNGEAKTIFVPSGRIEDMGIFVHLYESGASSEDLGDPRPVYFSSGILANNMIVAEESLKDKPEEVYLFKIYNNGDPLLPYNNDTREGGMYQALYRFDSGSGDNELLKPIAINGKVLIFDESLPQSFNPSEPNYEPDLRGFAIIGKKQVQAKAKVNTGLFIIDSDIATLSVEYSPIQKGEWTLPIMPTTFTGSEIDRATYITINP